MLQGVKQAENGGITDDRYITDPLVITYVKEISLSKGRGGNGVSPSFAVTTVMDDGESHREHPWSRGCGSL